MDNRTNREKAREKMKSVSSYDHLAFEKGGGGGVRVI